MSTSEPKKGEHWVRIDGKPRENRVLIHRVWMICDCDSPTMHAPCKRGAPVGAVRVVNKSGGSWFTVFPEFVKRYERETPASTRTGRCE